MIVHSLFVVLTGVASALSSPYHPRSEFKHFESHRAPRSFRKLSTAPPAHHPIDLKIGLKQPGFDRLEAHLLKSSDPFHPQYGHHLSAADAQAYVSPSDEAVASVTAWLEGHGYPAPALRWSAHRDWITLPSVPVSKAEEMLDTVFAVYEHDDGDRLVRTESFSLPEHLHAHIDVVQPTTMFGRLYPQRSQVSRVAEVKSSIPANETKCIPDTVLNGCLRSYYGTLNYTPSSTEAGNKIGITGYLGEAANYADLAKFLALERSDAVGYKFTFESVAGGANPQQLNSTQIEKRVGIEANLDTQTVAGFVAPTESIFYSTPGSPPFKPDLATPQNTNEPYLVWLEHVLALNDSALPAVITTSYADDEQTVPRSYAIRVCHELAQLTARGVSLLYSSGDHGVGPDGTCHTNDSTNTTAFLALFPVSCPYVTAVGALQNFSPEEAVSEDGPGGFYSGGGFSNYFPRPSYQKADVAAYLKSIGSTYSGFYNPSGRAYPDVSAQGAVYVIAWQSKLYLVGGTSASSPTFASIVTLLNDYRLSLGLSTLGFLNPWLYAKGREGLTDITAGSSAGCDTEGFPAAVGWDPVTGLGSPVFPKLQSLVKGYPGRPGRPRHG